MRDGEEGWCDASLTITAEERSRRIHDAFEAYYAERERRRLSAEACARRRGGWSGERVAVPALEKPR